MVQREKGTQQSVQRMEWVACSHLVLATLLLRIGRGKAALNSTVAAATSFSYRHA